MIVNEKVESDHHPVKVWIKGERERREKSKGESKRWRKK